MSALLLLSTAFATRVTAQTIRGAVADSAGHPLGDVTVELFDSAAVTAGFVRTGRDGRYTIRASEAGWYGLLVQRDGYARYVSEWLPLRTGETRVREVRLAHAVTLDPVVVEAQRTAIRARTILGMDVRTLGGIIITPAEIEAVSASAADYRDLVRARGIVGVTVVHGCVVLTRGTGCMRVYVNDAIVTDPRAAVDVAPPQEIAHIILLRPGEAGVLFGTGSQNGVLLIYTRGALVPR